MPCPPSGITDRDWEATPPAVKALVMRLLDQLEALSARVAQLEEQKGRSSRNSYPFRGRDVGGMNPPLSGIALRDQIAEQML
jgi:hypothetical protein